MGYTVSYSVGETFSAARRAVMCAEAVSISGRARTYGTAPRIEAPGLLLMNAPRPGISKMSS
jgi:hypothetical protein